jgi:serine/threonine protein kinase
MSTSISEILQINYSKEFDEKCYLGYGSFAVVFKAINKQTNKEFAIKKIPIDKNEADKCLKEIKLLKKLKGTYVVKYIDSWVERNTSDWGALRNLGGETLSYGHPVNDPNKEYLLYIQMELCLTTLKKVIEQLKLELEIEKSECLPKPAYVISCELFKEILESVDYLHKLKPPVIHRDLKPANILLTNGRNGRFVKLGDFGLAVMHEFEDQSHSKYTGTEKYRAPEVTEADIYSLGVISEDLFNIDGTMYS